MADRTENVGINIFINGKEVQNNVASIRREFRKAKADAATATRGSQEYIDATNRVKQLGGILRKHRQDISGVNSSWNKVKETAIGFLGGSVITKGFQLIGRGVSDAVNRFKGFEKQNSELASVLGKTRKETVALNKDAQALGAITSKSATEVSKLQTEYARLGFSQSEILKVTKDTIAGSDALQSELSDQAALVGGIIRAYGEDASAAGRINDVLAKSAASSALSFEKLNTAVTISAPAAKAANLSFERQVAILGTLADRNIDASTAGTGLRNILLDLSEKGLSWEEAMGQIREASDQNSKALELFGKRGATLGVILANNADSTDNLEQKLRNAGGTAQRMADTQLDNLQGSLVLLESAWEGFILSLEDGNGAFARSIRFIVDFGAAALNAFTQTESAVDSSIKKLEEEQNALAENVAKINDVNTSNRDRVKIVNDLKEQYPDLLGFIKGEKLSNEELKQAVDVVNGALTTRMSIQQALAPVEEYTTELQSRQKEAQRLLSLAIKEGTELLLEQGKADLLLNKTKEEQLAIIEDNTGFFDLKATPAIRGYRQFTEYAASSQQRLNDAQKNANAVITQLLSNKDELNKLTTEELRNLVLNNVLTDKSLINEAKKIIILRERKPWVDQNLVDQQEEIEQTKSLIDIQKEYLEAAKQLPETTEKELVVKNQKIKAIQEEIKRLEELGIGNMDTKTAVELLKEKIAELRKELEEQALTGKLSEEKLQEYRIAVTDLQLAEERLKIALGETNEEASKQKDEFDALFKDLEKQALKDDKELQSRRERANQELFNRNRDAYLANNEISLDDKIAFLEREKQLVLENDELVGAEKILIEKQINDEIEQLQAESLERRKRAQQEAVNAISSIVLNAAALLEAQENKELAEFNRRQDEKIAKVQERLDQRVGDQKANERELDRLRQERAEKENEIRREQFERAKTLRTIQAIINASQAVTATLAEYGGTPAGYALAAAVAAAAGLEIATIQSQEYQELGRGGILDGPSHKNGGLDVINPKTGKKELELEGNEAVIPVDTVKANRSLIDILLANHGRDVSNLVFGRDMPEMDFRRLSESVRLQNGGILDKYSPEATRVIMPTVQTKQVADKQVEEKTLDQSNDILVNKMDELIVATKEMKIVLPLEVLEEAQSDRDNIVGITEF